MNSGRPRITVRKDVALLEVALGETMTSIHVSVNVMVK